MVCMVMYHSGLSWQSFPGTVDVVVVPYIPAMCLSHGHAPVTQTQNQPGKGIGCPSDQVINQIPPSLSFLKINSSLPMLHANTNTTKSSINSALSSPFQDKPVAANAHQQVRPLPTNPTFPHYYLPYVPNLMKQFSFNPHHHGITHSPPNVHKVQIINTRMRAWQSILQLDKVISILRTEKIVLYMQ